MNPWRCVALALASISMIVLLTLAACSAQVESVKRRLGGSSTYLHPAPSPLSAVGAGGNTLGLHDYPAPSGGTSSPFVGTMRPSDFYDYADAPEFDLGVATSPGDPASGLVRFDQSDRLEAGVRARLEADAAWQRSVAEALAKAHAAEVARRDAAPFGVRDADEFWVIVKCPPAPDSPRLLFPGEDPTPGTGSLVTTPDGGLTPVPLPLRHTSVEAAVLGYVADVKVTQQFENPYSGKIEAVYVFPLPENAAVTDFIMTVGTRTIRGVIREREQAEAIYAKARAQGYVASLLTQERPNIFTQEVANIEPLKRVDVTLRYFHTLAYNDGAFEFVYPMVVGPRFNPPHTTDGVAAVPQGVPGQSGQATEVQYLRPDRRSTHDIDLKVTLDAGVTLERVECSSHATTIERTGTTRATVTLSRLDSVPNKDFVLRAHVAGDSVKSAMLTQGGRDGGHFTMMIVPPKARREHARRPLEVIFVLDASGSMNGRPIEQARDAIERGLARLLPGDTFQLINFAESASALGSVPVEATPQNVAAARAHLAAIQAAGGTMMINGLRASLDFPTDPRRSRYVVFLTDGHIGNEAEILGTLHGRLGRSRVFAFGVGSAPNRFLMDSMATMGQGVAAYLNANESSTDVIDLFFDRIEHAALTDLEIDAGRAVIADVYPSRLPDVFVGRPVIVTGRYEGRAPSRVRIKGVLGHEAVTIDARVQAHDDALAGQTVRRLWARARIADLDRRMTWDADRNLPGEVRGTALAHNLLSKYTAFIAVDSSQRTDGTFGTTVAVPVPVPEGVRYETTVQGGDRR